MGTAHDPLADRQLDLSSSSMPGLRTLTEPRAAVFGRAMSARAAAVAP